MTATSLFGGQIRLRKHLRTRSKGAACNGNESGEEVSSYIFAFPTRSTKVSNLALSLPQLLFLLRASFPSTSSWFHIRTVFDLHIKDRLEYFLSPIVRTVRTAFD